MTWISGKEAAAILSKNSGRTIKTDYLRSLAQKGLIRNRVNPNDPTTKQYWKEELEDRKVRGRTEKRTDGDEESDGEPLAMVG